MNVLLMILFLLVVVLKIVLVYYIMQLFDKNMEVLTDVSQVIRMNTDTIERNTVAVNEISRKVEVNSIELGKISNLKK